MKKISFYVFIGMFITSCYSTNTYEGTTYKKDTPYNFNYKKIVYKYELTNGNGCLYQVIPSTKLLQSNSYGSVTEFVCDCNFAKIDDIVELTLIQRDLLNIWYPLNSKIYYTDSTYYFDKWDKMEAGTQSVKIKSLKIIAKPFN